MSDPVPIFRDIAREAGVVVRHVNGASPDKHFPEIMGSGGLFLDVDNDGWIDIFLVDGGSIADSSVAATARHRLLRNRGDGTFEDITARSGIRHQGYGMGACAADYDNDGWVDLYITNVGPNVLYRNRGDGTFEDVTARAGVAGDLWSTSCAFADLDRDGHLDLFVTNYVDITGDPDRFCGHTRPPLRVYCHPLNFPPLPNVLYRNRGDGRFADDTERAGLAGYRSNGLGVVIFDADGDGWPDVFVANDALPDFLFRNDGEGRFTDMGLLAGVAVASDGQARAGMGTAVGDYDGDGRLDLIVTNHETEMHTLFRSLGEGVFADVTVASGVGRATLPYVGFGVVFEDLDNDTRPDLAIVNGHVLDNIAQIRSGASHPQARLLLRNAGGGRFEDVSARAGPGFEARGVGRTLAAGDIDNDGFLDLLVTQNGGPVALLRNEGVAGGQALLVRTIGTTSNRDGIGARLRLTVDGRTLVREIAAGGSYLGHSDRRAHFGLGPHARADRLEIRWPSGQVDLLRDIPASQVITVREGEGIVSRMPFAR
jgi:enediyne biosynthesis protein E4